MSSSNKAPRHDLKFAVKEEIDFLSKWPEFGKPSQILSLRNAEFRRLDDNDQVYVDYTGGGLHAQSQLQQHMSILSRNVFGNPHSKNPTSLAMTERVEQARKYVMDFFNASPDEYICVFTPNASGALKLVGESYPFADKSQYTLTCDNHNSVNGIREFARAKGSKSVYINMQGQDIRVDRHDLIAKLSKANQDKEVNNLFAFPAQSNFSGTQHGLDLIQLAKEYNHHVLVDFAAYAPTNRIDLTKWKPDFCCFSFYKIFGYPTGLGCLLVRKDTMEALKRPWFAGGTVHTASVSGDWHYLEFNEAAFEDGTIDYLNIPAIEVGLRTVEKLGMDKIKGRVKALTGYFIENLLKIRHSNGQPLVQLFGAPSTIGRGGTVTFLLKDPEGVVLDENCVEELANTAHISLRTGCFCNPGAGESAFKLSGHHTKGLSGSTKEDLYEQLFLAWGVSIAAIRVSFGMASNFQDAFRVLDFAKSFMNKSCTEVGGLIRKNSPLHGLKPQVEQEQEEGRDYKKSFSLLRRPSRRGSLKKVLSKLGKMKALIDMGSSELNFDSKMPREEEPKSMRKWRRSSRAGGGKIQVLEDETEDTTNSSSTLTESNPFLGEEVEV